VATGGTTGQLLAKASGTNYDTTWTTVIPGDRYLTSSTTSLTINNANKTLTIGTGLSYSPQQDVIISESTSPTTRHMHARVTSYDSGTGVMVVDVISHSGTGTYTSWVVNVGGVTPAASVAWGAITGTLSSQTDLQDALDLKYDASNPSAFIDATALTSYAPLAGPAFSGTATFTGSGGTVSISDLSLDLSASTGGGAVIVGTSGITFSDSTIQQTAYNPDRAKADAIANIIYTQSSGSTGDICFSNVPQFISNLTTNWGIVDNSLTYENCTGFSGATYSLSGSVGSGPYTVRVNGVDSSFTI
jgi:hypothetical protein